MHDETPKDPAEIRRDIEATRERIAETAEAIAYQTDVQARLKDEITGRVETAKVVAGETASAARDAIADARDTVLEATAEARVTAAEIAAIARQAVEDVTRTTTANVQAAIVDAKPAIADVSEVIADAGRATTAAIATTVAGASDIAADVAADPGSAARGVAKYAARNPVELAIMSFLVGIVVGMLLPVGRRVPQRDVGDLEAPA